MEVNDYLKQMEDRDQAERARLAASANLAIDSSPEEIARQKRISEILRVPVAAVQGDPVTARQQATLTTWQQNTTEAPATREKYTDADFAALAQDQSGALAKVERFTRNLASGAGGTFIGEGLTGMGDTLRSLERLTGSKSITAEWFETVGPKVEKYFKDFAPKGEASNVDQYAQGIGQVIGQVGSMFNPVTRAASVGLLIGQGSHQMKQKIEQDKVAQKADQNAQDVEVLTGGAITGITEYLTSKLFAGMVKPAQVTMLKSKLAGYALRLAEGAASEGVQETSENLLQDITHIALTNPDAKVGLAEAAHAGGIGAAVGATMSALMNAALHVKTRRFQQSLTDLSDASKAQQVRERDPETYQGFADAITGHLAGTTDGAVENLYVDANVFAQAMTENKIDPAKAVAAMGIDPQIFDEAKVTGGDLVIPMNDFVGKVAGTEIGDMLNPHLRSAPDAVSIAELAEIAKIAPDLQAKADQIAAKQTERKEWTQSMAEVQRTIADQLIATGIYSPSVSRMQSSLAANMYANIASEMGITPAELYQMKPYKVEMGELNKDQSGITYNQEGNINIDENFKNWFGESKVVDAEGKPLVVYHGSPDARFMKDDATFKNRWTGKTKGAHWFTPSKQTAKTYADDTRAFDYQNAEPNIIPAYLSMKNPLIVEANGANWRDAQRRGETSNVIKEAQEQGHDGVIIRNVKDDYNNGVKTKPTDTYVVFDSTQIKSVNNRGTFDPNNPNILMQSAWHGSPHTFDKFDENFKNWFGESKVVDTEGKPLVMYHGTGTTIEAFDPSFTGKGNDQLGSGFYFTTDSDQAKGYETHTLPFSNVGKLGGNDNPNTVSAYVSIKKPILLSADQDNLRDVVITQRQAAEIIKRAPNIYDADESPLVNWIDNNGKNFTPNQVDKIAKEYDNPLTLENDFFRDSPTEFRQALHDATGYDGVIKEFPDGSKHVVSWFPTQIKSVFNTGTFDPNNPNILMQSAWHGSPHTFDKFSTSAIGTGEGAQAYGYGLYFAGAKDVAEWYRDKLAGQQSTLIIDGQEFGNTQQEYSQAADVDRLIMDAYIGIGKGYKSKKQLVAELKSRAKGAFKNWKPIFKEAIAKAQTDAVDINTEKGKLYKVELAPAEDEYLLWDKPLSEQSEKVREALAEVGGTPADIEKAIALYSGRQNLEGARGEMAREEIAKLQRRLDNANLMTGEELYKRFSQENQKGDRAASEYLHSLGIRGIKYEDGNTRNKDGEKNYNYVIFSDDDVAIQEMYQKINGRKRAGFDPSRLTTVLTKESDLSSFFHETGHFFLTVYSDLAADPNATPRMQQDMQTILDWFGVKDLAAWNAMTLEEQRPYHEQFAYNYEIYLFEGKAPSIQMQTVFERFSAWLKKVYSSIRDELNQVYKKEHGKDLPILTGEVRDVMDRMLASDKQIREAEAVRGMMPIFRTQEESGMTDEEWIAYQSMSDEAHQAALDQHTQASLRQMKWLEGAKSKVLKGLQAQAKEARAKVKAEVTQEVMMEPIYRAIQFLKTGEAVFSEGKSVKEEGPHKLSIEALKQMYPDKPAKEKKVKPPKFRSFLGDISKAGGITYDSLVRALDVNEIRGDKGGNRFMAITGRKGRGWGMDQMAGMMQDQGWDVPMDVDGNLDTDAFAQMVKEAVNGNRPVHPDDVSTVVEQEDAARALAEDDDYLKSLVEFYDQQQIDPGYPEWQTLGYGKSGMLAEDGLHPDLIAGLFGFHSGDALVRTLLDTAPIKKTINSVTDQRMLEEHGELTDPKALAIAVDRAIHNEARARFIAVELRHLAKSVRPVRVMQEAARQAARAIIGKKPIGTINPKDYSGAEAKAAVAAETAMKKGDTAAATQAKEHQLLQNMLASESLKANTFVAEQLDGFKKVFSPDKRLSKTRDMNYVNVARSILAHYGIGSATETADSYLSKIRQYDPEFYAEIEPMITAHQEASKFATDLTFDQFQDLADQVQMLWHLSRRVKQIEIDGQLMDRKEVVGMLDSRIRSLIKPGERAGYTKAMTKWDEAKIKLMGVRASLRRVESWVDAMDGGNPAGPFRTFIWNPISEAVTKFRGAQGKYFGRYVEILKEAEITLQGQDIVAEELDYTFKPQELLHAILHTGNSSNKRKLLLGRGWAEFSEDGETLDTSRWDTFINRAVAEGRITKDYYDFAQKVWDLMEEMKPGAQKAHHDMYGYYFNEITAEALETPWGVYAGGYVPAVTDARIVTEGALRNEQETQMADNSFMFPTTGRGFTKGRVEYNRPLLLDLGYLASHIDKVLRFTYIEPRVKDVARIVKTNKAFGETMDELDPTVRNDMLVPWLQRTAMQMVSTPSKGWGGKAADSFFTYLRTNTGMQMMVANVTNTLQQFTGLSISALKVKPSLLRNALWQYTRQPGDTAQMVADKSDYMKTRMTAQQYEMRQKMDALLLNPTKYDKVVEFAKEHGYFMQQATQNIVDTITWVGAYNQAVQTGVSEKDAVRQADSAVRQTQGSFAPEDISRFETGSAFVRAFTHFYSYFNMQANVLGTEFVKVARELGVKDGAGKMLYIYTFGFMIPAVLSEMIVQAAGGFDAGDDDEYDLWNAMGLFFGSQFRTLSAMVPGVGPAVVAGVNAWNRKPYDDRMSTSPAVSTIEATVSAPHSVYKAIAEDGSWKKATRDTLTALGLITRLPLGQLGKPAGYLMDVQQGKAEPEGVTDVVRGLISGKDVNRKQ